MADVPAAVTVTGEGHDADKILAASDALYVACLLLAGRLYYRGEAPLGIAAGADFGGLYVGWTDPDLRRLLLGKRGREISPAQAWPSTATIKDRWRIGSAVADDRVNEIRAAAIEHMHDLVSRRSFGVA